LHKKGRQSKPVMQDHNLTLWTYSVKP